MHFVVFIRPILRLVLLSPLPGSKAAAPRNGIVVRFKVLGALQVMHVGEI